MCRQSFFSPLDFLQVGMFELVGLPLLLSNHRTDGSQPYLMLPLGQWNGEETPHSNTPNIWSRSHKWAGREFWQVSEVVWSASFRLCLPGKESLGTGSQTPRSPCSLGPPPLITRTELTIWLPIMRRMLLKVRHLSGSSSQLAYPHYHNTPYTSQCAPECRLEIKV